MLLIWRGWGILAVIIPVMFFLLSIAIAVEVNIHNVIIQFLPLISLFISGPVVWFTGVKLNNTQPRNLIDPKTQQKFTFKKVHSLFWIPMQYYGIIILAFGILIVIQKLFMH